MKNPTSEEDKAEYQKAYDLVVKSLEIKNPVKLMFVGRMVKLWQKINYIDECMKQQGLYFKRMEKGAIVGISVNQLAFLQKQLEAELRNYYRLLNQKWNQEKEETADDFIKKLDEIKLIEQVKEVKDGETEDEDESGSEESPQ